MANEIQLEKYEELYNSFYDLAKADIGLSEALKIARDHNKDAGKVLARHIYTDRLVPKVGNLYAYNDFLNRNRNTGIHISMDANSFGQINKEHGFEMGNQAIKHLFTNISDASRKYGLKSFRIGGDEARLHAPDQKRAEGFAKDVKEMLSMVPKMGGTHQISASIGIGYSPDHAEQALMVAKKKLFDPTTGVKKFKPGEEPSVDHSLLHEDPPLGWKPHSGKLPSMPHEEPAKGGIVGAGLKLKNPL